MPGPLSPLMEQRALITVDGDRGTVGMDAGAASG
jgi:hypothetical protein